jgi:hypothetical protein
MQCINVMCDNITTIFNRVKIFSVNNIFNYIENKRDLFLNSRYFKKKTPIVNVTNIDNYHCVNNCKYKCNCEYGWFVVLDV